MRAAEFLAFLRPRLGPPASPAARFFLSLPERLEAAAGEGRFFESSVSTARGWRLLKLAHILREDLASLPAGRRDAPGAADAAEAVLDSLEAAGPGRDRRTAAAVLSLLRSWGLRGSLMLSLDLDLDRAAFDKLSLYAYLPGPSELGALLAPFGLAGHEPELRALAGPSLAFFGVDLPAGGPAVLKLYNKTPWPDRDLPEAARAASSALAEVGPLRDVTRLTRAGSGAPPKVYLGFARGAPLCELARLRAFGGASGPLAALGPAERGLKARFAGFDRGAAEVYFDADGYGPREDRAS